MNKRSILIEAFCSIIVLIQLLIYPLQIIAVIVREVKKCLKYTICKRGPPIAGEVALVTGSGRGLGREIAIALAKHGCHIAIADIQEKLAEETAILIAEKYQVKTKSYKLLDLQEKITADLGDVTILVNNAGILTLSSVENPPAHEVQRMINVNLTAPIYTTQIFLPKMKQLNRGYIVNISSILSMYPHYFFNVYGATKAALRYITSCLRIDLLESGSDVRAITICPSFLTTNKRINELLKVFRLHRLLCDIDGSIVAQYIIEAMLRGEEELTVPRVFILCYRLLATLPITMTEMILATIGKFAGVKNNQKSALPLLEADDIKTYF